MFCLLFYVFIFSLFYYWTKAVVIWGFYLQWKRGTDWQAWPALVMPVSILGPCLAQILTWHLSSFVSSKFRRTSRPPRSQIASWYISCIKLRFSMAHRVSTVAVWSPACNNKTKFEWIINGNKVKEKKTLWFPIGYHPLLYPSLTVLPGLVLLNYCV